MSREVQQESSLSDQSSPTGTLLELLIMSFPIVQAFYNIKIDQ